MNDVNKQIEEAKALAKKVIVIENKDKFSNEADMRVAEYLCYKALKEQNKSSRWRKVRDELPKVASKPYCIVVRSDDGRVQLEWILVGYDEGVISFLLDKYVEWKPID